MGMPLSGPVPVSVAASVPSDIIDNDRPWWCPPVLWPVVTLGGGTGDRRPPAVDGVCSESAGRCPRRCGGGNWEAKEELRETEGRADEWTAGSSFMLRWRSPPVAKPFCLLGGERSRVASVGATFLKVMVHSTSSPANTVGSFHCTNTRMFDADMVGRANGTGCEGVGSSSGATVKRHGDCYTWAPENEQRQRTSIELGEDGGNWSGVKVLHRRHVRSRHASTRQGSRPVRASPSSRQT
jgi:hypothetical protein